MLEGPADPPGHLTSPAGRCPGFPVGRGAEALPAEAQGPCGMTQTVNGAAPEESVARPHDPAAQRVGSPRSGLPRLLDLLGYTETERLSVCHAWPGRPASFAAQVLPPGEAEAEVVRWQAEADVWFGINPVDPGVRGRGTIAQVTRWAAIYADLDVKDGGLPNYHAARAVITDLSALLGVCPVAVIGSGHGLQPVWAMDPDDPATQLDDPQRRADAVALLRRFGRLVTVVAERHGGRVDSVFDLARVLRVPGTTNRKRAPLRPVRVELFDAAPLGVDQLMEVLDAYGAPERSGDRELLGEVVSDPCGWSWAKQPCDYVTGMVDGWQRDLPRTGRHPWLVAQATRLACAHRYGCLIEAEYQRAAGVLRDRFEHLCRESIGGDPRQPHRGEVADALAWGVARAASLTYERITKELGNHSHQRPDPMDLLPDVLSAPVRADPVPAGVPARRGRRVLLEDAPEEIESVEWWWADRLPRGCLALLAGREGIGKSLIAYWLAAQLTRGTLPGCWLGEPKTVIVCATEDSWKHTITPRLLAAGADISRVKRTRVVTEEHEDLSLSLPDDVNALTDVITECGDVGLLLLDPLISRLDARLDTHKDADVRAALEPLAALADRTGIGVVGLIHVNKGSHTDPLTSIMASRAFAAVARAVAYAIVDRDDPAERLLGVPKNNLGRDDLPTLRYRIETVYVGQSVTDKPVHGPRIVWAGEDGRSVADVMDDNASGGNADRSAIEDATAWLEHHLAHHGGLQASREVKAAGKAAGHAEATLKRAAKRLQVESRAVGYPRQTYWILPGTQPDQDDPRSDHAQSAHRPGESDPTEPTGPRHARRPRQDPLFAVGSRNPIGSVSSVGSDPPCARADWTPTIPGGE